MTKVRTTLTVDDEVLRWVKIKAVRTGQPDGAVIEAALRQALGMDLIDGMWNPRAMAERDALALGSEAQHRTRTSED